MRDRSIDILKGISILGIMLLHYEQGIFSGMVNCWIGSFMVSAFYFSNAWILSTKELPTIPETWRKLKSSLGIPYVSFSILICLFTLVMCLFQLIEWRILFRDIYKACCLRGIGTLWFLPALAFGQLLFLWFWNAKLLGKILLFSGTVIYSGCYWTLYAVYREQSSFYKIIDAPLNELWRIGDAWIAITVFYLFAKYFRNEIDNWSWKQKTAAFLITFILYTGVIYNCWGTFLGGFLGAITVFFFVKCTESWKINQFFAYCGRNSLIIMVLHFSILQQICILINRHYTGAEGLQGYPSLVYFAVSIIVLIPLIMFFQKYALFMLGKKK